MAFSTACRAWSLTSGLPLITRDAVARETPAAAATCLIVTFRDGKTANLGSGLLVSPDGLVITNDHVIQGETSIWIIRFKRGKDGAIDKEKLAAMIGDFDGLAAFAKQKSSGRNQHECDTKDRLFFGCAQ